MVGNRSVQEEIDLLKQERDELEREIDLAVFGREVAEDGMRPSMASYSEAIWEEEIALDPELPRRLALARETQQEIRELDQHISDLKEELAQEGEL